MPALELLLPAIECRPRLRDLGLAACERSLRVLELDLPGAERGLALSDVALPRSKCGEPLLEVGLAPVQDLVGVRSLGLFGTRSVAAMQQRPASCMEPCAELVELLAPALDLQFALSD